MLSWCEIDLQSAGDYECKPDDAHSLGSGAGEGYEPISDDELDEILAGDAEKREDQQDEEKMPGDDGRAAGLLSYGGWGVKVLLFPVLL